MITIDNILNEDLTLNALAERLTNECKHLCNKKYSTYLSCKQAVFKHLSKQFNVEQCDKAFVGGFKMNEYSYASNNLQFQIVLDFNARTNKHSLRYICVHNFLKDQAKHKISSLINHNKLNLIRLINEYEFNKIKIDADVLNDAILEADLSTTDTVQILSNFNYKRINKALELCNNDLTKCKIFKNAK